jgi:hypothetical protein
LTGSITAAHTKQLLSCEQPVQHVQQGSLSALPMACEVS